MRRAVVKVILFSVTVLFVLSGFGLAGSGVPSVSIPGVSVRSISFNNDLGLYEVVSDRAIFYITANGKYVIMGEILDARTLKSVTRERMNEVFRIDFSRIPLEDGIKISEGKRKIAVFTSPYCPYCRKLHEELKKLKDVSVYLFIAPLGERSVLKAILCDNSLLDTAYRGKSVESNETNCKKAESLDRVGRLMGELRITGIPTIFFEDGTRLDGYVPAEKIAERASGGKK